MSVSIIDRSGVLTAKHREDAERRLLYSLSRFHPSIKRVSLVVVNVNGSRGDAEKWCRLAVRLRRAHDVVISDQDADLATCISRLSDRAGRAVGLAVERGRRVTRFPDGSPQRPASV